jgi:hypothetical protein
MDGWMDGSVTDSGNLKSGWKIRPKTDGVDQTCTSVVCRGGNCCCKEITGGCVGCDGDGSCDVCSSG